MDFYFYKKRKFWYKFEVLITKSKNLMKLIGNLL